METISCPGCRSVNQVGVPRCMNCGYILGTVEARPSEAVILPGTALPPEGDPEWSSWTATVAPTRPPRKRSGLAISLGLVSVFGLLALALSRVGAPPGPSAQGDVVVTSLIGLVNTGFWAWMVFDSIVSGRFVWTVAVLFLGPFGGLAYAVLAMSRPAKY